MTEFEMCVTGDRPRVIYKSLHKADSAIAEYEKEFKRSDKEPHLCKDCGFWHTRKKKQRPE